MSKLICIFFNIILSFLGKCDNFLYALITFIAIEIITTALVSIMKHKNLSRLNSTFFSQKIAELLLVVIGHTIDVCLPSNGNTFRAIIISFYIGYEGAIILANIVKLGLPVPSKLKEFLERLLHENEDEKDKHDN